jgi:hypothetical protein
MKLTKSKLKRLIKEQLVRTLLEGDVIQGPWAGEDHEGDELPPEFQYEYVLDELVNASQSN